MNLIFADQRHFHLIALTYLGLHNNGQVCLFKQCKNCDKYDMVVIVTFVEELK